ncbi:MAG TPA: flagellar export chaperone FliS [Opitutaceae bacterium]
MVAQGYAQAYRATAVLTASPGQLVLMLFDGALKSLAIAQDAFSRPPSDRTRIEVINRHLLKAQSILAELQGGLNMEEGGEFAQTMHRLYDYHMRRLFEANVRKKVEPVVEVERLIREVRDAWAEMLSRRDSTIGEGSRVA